MSNSMPDERCLRALTKLTEFETEVIEILCLCYRSTSHSDLMSVMKARGVAGENGKLVTAAGLAKALADLKARTLVEERGKSWRSARDITEVVTRRMAETERFAAALPLVRSVVAPSARWGYSTSYVTDNELVVLIRLALYARDFEQLDKLLDAYWKRPAGSSARKFPITAIINSPFDPDWLGTYPADRQGFWLNWLLQDQIGSGERADAAMTYADVLRPSLNESDQVDLAYSQADGLFLQGRFEELPALASRIGYFGEVFLARRDLANGNFERAIEGYESVLQGLLKRTRKRKTTFGTSDWLFFIIALIAGGEAFWPRAAELTNWGMKEKDFPYQAICGRLSLFIRVQNGQATKEEIEYGNFHLWQTEQRVLSKLFVFVLDMWLGRDTVQRSKVDIGKMCDSARENGYHWLEHELAALLERAEGKARQKRGAVDTPALVNLIRPTEPWERTLKALAQISSGDSAAGSEGASRLAWILSIQAGHWDLVPLEQKRSAKGTWSKGRTMSLQRLRENIDTLDFLLPEDRRVCAQIKVEMEDSYWGRPRTSYYLANGALPLLAGHPHVFLAETGANVEVVTVSPSLQVASTSTGFKIKVTPALPEGGRMVVEREGDARVVVYDFPSELARIAGMLGKGLSVPSHAKERVVQAVRNVASMVTVHSDLDMGDESITKAEGDATPVLQLLPSGEGLLVQLRVRPLPGGPAFAPAAGGEVVIADVNGTRLQAARDMKQESARADALIASCSSLAAVDLGTCEWRLETPEEALEFLSELEESKAEARVEWPRGQKFTLRGTAGTSQFRARVNAGHNWFEVSGELKINDELVLDMQRLLELTAESQSRFIALGDGQFVALTLAFRRKLDELRGVGETIEDGLRMHALAAPLMDDLLAQSASVKANKKWKEQVQRLQVARDLDPEVPHTLRATLRDYQVEGFKWLARLAEWGVGACLADDMGLGKTVQLLALMLRRAADGPQLVIAPTSVCANWESEATRFAPSLKVYRFGLNNRQETIAALGSFDVLICSYGLLQSENDLLKSVEWRTIVLDEAQAIKNTASKRSKSAMALNGDFKIASTGTPIENHLGELWNLYRFINPGFLGSLEQFNGRFALPIEKYENRDAGRHLKQLIQPFMLRRRKEDVLSELPARTDIVLHVELGDTERAFYEALRQQALKQLSDVKAAPGKNHVRILAEIMRLRRACCNARLVEKTSSLPSAKLEVFEALLDELLENRHQALVFSQFVDHLAILRDLLDQKRVAYQYLDGSTPAPARKKAVDAFQGGEGDVFLISLKAGGLGLNLTAADYVIHMDPWWNPAVEDQASDRAHRIGQLRPVTVYRLVAKDTIEDQITDLHLRKRDLANSLLEGADMAGKISSEELLELLQMG